MEKSRDRDGNYGGAVEIASQWMGERVGARIVLGAQSADSGSVSADGWQAASERLYMRRMIDGMDRVSVQELAWLLK